MSARGCSYLSWLVLALLALIVLMQLRLWTGTGGVPEVTRLRERVEAQREENAALKRRNEALEADVRDLKTGREAVEERARSELGMTRPGETFYQVVEPTPPAREGESPPGQSP